VQDGGAALPPDVGHFQQPRRPDALHVLHVALVQAARKLIFNEALVLSCHVIVFPNPHASQSVLGMFCLAWDALRCASRGRHRKLLACKAVIELIDIALLDVLEEQALCANL